MGVEKNFVSSGRRIDTEDSGLRIYTGGNGVSKCAERLQEKGIGVIGGDQGYDRPHRGTNTKELLQIYP